jgi:hypothetical protein
MGEKRPMQPRLMMVCAWLVTLRISKARVGSYCTPVKELSGNTHRPEMEGTSHGKLFFKPRVESNLAPLV